MKNIFKVIAIAAGVLIVTGCVEDEMYSTNNGYYSSGSGVTTTYNSATVGYNRNYQPPAPTVPGNNGYSSSGSGSYRSSTQGSSGGSGYSSSG